ncbi:DinB family protein [Streptacidiphilus pinicola]|uniref:DinB family protein n=1 Tax=Streptacidiphilus pinicola TaxID=2219663 RepID=A0A2X0IZ04_9ACTN|nr:DinB family protein [Streptacidiphilus pinicola]RAG83126.1 DinB family protein [Streptacidiphilus pinicola]
MSARQNPVTSDVLMTFDEVRDRLLARLEGMSDAEYLWEPVADCLTVRVGPDGAAHADERPHGTSGQAPFATIAWRAWHIGSDCLRGYARLFGEPPIPPAARQLWPATAKAGVAALAEDIAAFRARVAALGDTRLLAPMGPPAAPYDADSFLALATHAIDETAHHGAEIALLRDLHAHGLGGS